MSIETKLAEISAGLCPNVDGCDTCDTKRKLVAALRTAIGGICYCRDMTECYRKLGCVHCDSMQVLADIEQIMSKP